MTTTNKGTHTPDNLVVCVYCGADVHDVPAPHVGDADAWAAIAREHADWCDWVETRAHRIDLREAR